MHKLRINPIARADLLEIREYITNELGSPIAASNTVSKIINCYEKLKDYPLLGTDLSSKIGIETDHRCLIAGNYIVFYTVDETYVSIYRVIYGRRDYMKILFGEMDSSTDNN